MVIKADSPATFAEKYIIESIWNNHFPQGSILPAERELSELIGVTRTTLREVLQRLARDGWLTIQHGKPTRVNDFMHTSGLNILDTLVMLDGQDVQAVVENMLSARTDISGIYMRYALRGQPEAAAELIDSIIRQCQQLLAAPSLEAFLAECPDDLRLAIQQELKKIIDRYGKEDTVLCEQICRSKVFNFFDYKLFQGLAFLSGNKVYVLTLNGLRKIYSRVGGYYFMDPQACQLALDFYADLKGLCSNHGHQGVPERVKQYGRESGVIWMHNKEQIANYMADEE
ncbi:Fatty acid metabolism regulator protein [Vibrio stylophorae]|uniref:Fatty acid metabolism regulator protein n=1 Tax=Vibrio stylophorae TaxID=659351 RepID=A0ABM8ZU68_9VIBR|nr:fatty acid metabolism transcriptional regulator FadR [Vibrio stylophorae]CAH0533859.1 Fatty acid metabolism regulator protein [Vibrio stylophorae]